MIPRPKAKYLGDQPTHPLEHAEDLGEVIHTDDLIGASAHLPSPDLRNEEPSGELEESTEP